MPELPEVETVRVGLARSLPGRRVRRLEVLHPRTARRQQAPGSLPAQSLVGRVLEEPCRRGKFLWLPTRDGVDAPLALSAHLGMSGQLRVASEPDPQWAGHVRAVVDFEGTGPSLWFVDQRTFGWLTVESLVEDEREGLRVPASVAHIAPDVFEEQFDDAAWNRALRRRHTTVKRALLDQTLQSGVGNIYADEALWRARLHPERRTHRLTRGHATDLLAALRTVMSEALAAGGTSFDAMYVDVTGSGGYFARSLAVYGRAGRPCPRCGTDIVREPFGNRSSHYCPACQRRPRKSPADPAESRPENVGTPKA